jgi:hypothetical protein
MSEEFEPGAYTPTSEEREQLNALVRGASVNLWVRDPRVHQEGGGRTNWQTVQPEALEDEA